MTQAPPQAAKPAAGISRRAALAGVGQAFLPVPAAHAGPAVRATTLAGFEVQAHAPARLGPLTPLVLLLPGLGPPRTPTQLASALPPLEGAVSLYAPLPFSPGAPGGGVDELARRQQEDYAGSLLVPILRETAGAVDALVRAATRAYGLSPERPVHLFGFSMGGAAVLAALSRAKARPRSVVALNAPLSVRAAVSAYERKLQVPYRVRREAVFAAYDLAAEAAQIRRRGPRLRLRLIQAVRDDQFSAEAARRVVEAFNAGRAGPAELMLLPIGGHNALFDDPDTQARVRRLLQDLVSSA